MRSLVAVILSAMVVAGCSTPNTADRPLLANGEPVMSEGAGSYEKGKQNLRAGNYGLAASQLRSALRNDPISLDILNALALTYERLGRHDVSQRYFAQALAIDPQSVQTLNNIARSLLDKGSVAIAVSYLRRAEALDPHNSVVQANLADITRRERPNSGARLASDFDSRGPSTTWIERTSVSKQTLITRGNPLGFSDSVERRALLPLVSFAAFTDGEKPYVELKAAAVANMPVSPKVRDASLPRVVVANGNGRTGMAARTRSYLEERGLRVGGLMNADQFNYATTTIAYRAEHEAEARRLAAMLPVKAALEERSDLTADVVLRIGRDILPFDRVMDA